MPAGPGTVGPGYRLSARFIAAARAARLRRAVPIFFRASIRILTNLLRRSLRVMGCCGIVSSNCGTHVGFCCGIGRLQGQYLY